MSAPVQFRRKHNWVHCLCQVPCPGCYDPREDRAPHPYPGKQRLPFRIPSPTLEELLTAVQERASGVVVH